ARPALGVALERPLGPVELAVEQEVELDGEGVRLLVEELMVVLSAAAVVAEEREGDGVEDGRLARAVEAGEHPQGGVAVELDGLLVLVAEEALEPDALGDHRLASFGRGPERDRRALMCRFRHCRTGRARRANPVGEASEPATLPAAPPARQRACDGATTWKNG